MKTLSGFRFHCTGCRILIAPEQEVVCYRERIYHFGCFINLPQPEEFVPTLLTLYSFTRMPLAFRNASVADAQAWQEFKKLAIEAYVTLAEHRADTKPTIKQAIVMIRTVYAALNKVAEICASGRERFPRSRVYQAGAECVLGELLVLRTACRQFLGFQLTTSELLWKHLKVVRERRERFSRSRAARCSPDRASA